MLPFLKQEEVIVLGHMPLEILYQKQERQSIRRGLIVCFV